MSKRKNIKSNDSFSRIDAFRKAIDEIDEKILDLINQRLLHSKEIGKVKKQKGNQIFDGSREGEIMNRLSALNNGPIRNASLLHIFSDIIAESRQIQSAQVVTYLGPEATFTHIAAMNHFGRSATFLPQPGIRDVFSEVEKESCNYGVVPVENSIEGAVNLTLDLLAESDLKICAEKYLSISHDLLSATGSLDDIRQIYSHPHAFAQCRKWIKEYLPKAILCECSSTAQAAQTALKQPGSAAIASNEAAQIYNLKIVASKVEDYTRNVTRFLIIGKDAIQRTGNDKTSIMFVTSHIPGALFKVLEPIAGAGINMLKLESRPSRHENWNYSFFVDLEGHIEDQVIADTIAEMKNICLYLKSLGSYPRAPG